MVQDGTRYMSVHPKASLFSSLGDSSFTCQHSKRRWSLNLSTSAALWAQRPAIQRQLGEGCPLGCLEIVRHPPQSDEGPALFGKSKPFGHGQHIFGTRSASDFESNTPGIHLLRPALKPRPSCAHSVGLMQASPHIGCAKVLDWTNPKSLRCS